ncbi:MAG: hypothetical protein DGJ47_001048 [Rickettsiaceae bacterium]
MTKLISHSLTKIFTLINNVSDSLMKPSITNALFSACYRADYQSIKSLIAQGGNIDTSFPSSYKKGPLWFDAYSTPGEVALFLAQKNNDMDFIQHLKGMGVFKSVHVYQNIIMPQKETTLPQCDEVKLVEDNNPFADLEA